MKRLGQHFLVNREALFKAASALELKNSDTVIEIGPGHGELTSAIRKMNPKTKIIVIERDDVLAKKLPEKEGFAATEVIAGDALEILPELSKKIKNFKLAGNIPYYITGHLLRTIGDLDHKPLLTVLTIQREVAERLVSGPPDMNQLAASVQFWGTPMIIGHLSPNDFRPAPKVHSTTIKILTKKPAPTQKEAEFYYRALKTLFRQPRKTVLNNLVAKSEQIAGKTAPSKGDVSNTLQKLGINPLDRPQNLAVDDIVKISGLLTSKPAAKADKT